MGPLYHGTLLEFQEFIIPSDDFGFHFGGKQAAIKRVQDAWLESSDLRYEEFKVINIISRKEATWKLEYFGGGNKWSPRIFEVSLDIKNPIRMKEFDRFSKWTPDLIFTRLFEVGHDVFVPQSESGVTDQEIAAYLDLIYEETDMKIPNMEIINYEYFQEMKESQETHYAEWLKKFLINKGFDGIVYLNTAEGDGDSYISLYPNQITIDNIVVLDKEILMGDILDRISPITK